MTCCWAFLRATARASTSVGLGRRPAAPYSPADPPDAVADFPAEAEAAEALALAAEGGVPGTKGLGRMAICAEGQSSRPCKVRVASATVRVRDGRSVMSSSSHP